MKKIGLAMAVLACAGTAHAGDDANDPAVVPYRPSVSTPAQAVGAGLAGTRGRRPARRGPERGTSRTTLPWTLKLAFTPDWGIRVGGDAWVRQADAGDTQTSVGDTSVVLKRRFALSDASAFGLELGEAFPTARDSVGIGHAQTTLNGIFSSDFAAGWHTDLNVNETRGSGAGAAWQAGWAAAVSRSLSDAWGAVGEFSGTHQAGAPGQAQFLAAASWNESNAAVFDFGAAHGLNDASPRWQVFAGVTVRLGKLF